MEISIFDVAGPVMIGPSSSHTAGAAKLSRIASLIVAKKFNQVSFGLHGSFAKTYSGHGTDKALVAGALGFFEDDENLVNSFEIAKEKGLNFNFYETELDYAHENTVKMSFKLEDNSIFDVVGSSIGGGQILITRINDFETSLSAHMPTLIIRQQDQKGVVTKVTKILSDWAINIGHMDLSRKSKGDVACCIIETDNSIPDGVVSEIQKIQEVISAQAINI